MELLLAAGAAGLAAYALGRRRERHQMANGFVTYSGNDYDSPQYANIHYGRSARNYSSHPRHHYSTGSYYPMSY